MSKFEEFDDQKKERFDEVSEKEQIQRFVNLKSLFADKKKLTEQGGDKEKMKRANYFDFIVNAYKYPDEIKIKDGEEPIDYSQIFSQAETGNEIIKEILKIFLKFKKNDNKLNSNLFLGNLGLVMEKDMSFIEEKNDQVLLDVEKLKKMFRWCLIAFVKKGKSIGREPADINEEDIGELCDDLEDIVNQMNSMFIKSKTLNSIV